MPASPTRILFRDEFRGYAKSKVMLIMWGALPVVAMAGFLLLPNVLQSSDPGRPPLAAVTAMTLLMASTAGLVAALLAAVDVVSEKNRNVYVLYSVRPIKREIIIWAKFLAIGSLVIVGCLVSITIGFAVDALRGDPVTSARLVEAGKAIVSMAEVIAMSAAVGLLFGVIARSILGAVLLTLYVGQNLLIVPMLPVYMRIAPESFELIMGISTGITIGVLLLAARMFRRLQL